MAAIRVRFSRSILLAKSGRWAWTLGGIMRFDPNHLIIMLCERCHEREAIIHITAVRDGQMKKENLCAGCEEEHLKHLLKDIPTAGWTSYGPNPGGTRFDAK